MALTEEQRKQNAKTTMIYMSVVLAVLASYFLGYIFAITGEEGCSFADAFARMKVNMTEIKLIPPLNGMLFLGILAGALLGLLIYFIFSVDYERNYSYKLDEVAGSGGFMTKKAFQAYNKRYIAPEPKDQDAPSPNMILGNTMRKPNEARKMQGTNNNVLIVGGAGTGKTRFLIKPNLLQMNCSFVITDPSGEIIQSCGKTLIEHGYKIKIFNTSEMQYSNTYNPISYIRDQAGVRMVIDCLINNTSDKDGKGEDFWKDAERLLYSACIFYLLEFCNDASKKNFTTIARMINNSLVDENNPMAKSPLDKMFDQVPTDSLAWTFYKGFKQAGARTLKSIIISCIARLQPFMTPQVSNLTKTDSLELDKIGDEKTALFIIVPQADFTYSFLTAMLYSQLFETLYFKGEQQKAAGGSERLKIPVRCMMDEFPNMGEIPAFPSKLATMRKYNISATVVLQDLSQIEAMYKEEWRTIVGNCSSIVFLGGQEQNTLKYFSDMLGKMTVTSRSRGFSRGLKSGFNRNFNQTGREVMTPDELSRMDAKNEIVFIQGLRPVLDQKYHYEEHPMYPLTSDADVSRAFIYKGISAYDNSKLGISLDNLLKAQAEITKYVEEGNITASKSTDEIRLKGDLNEAYNSIILEKKAAAVGRMHAIQNAVEEITSTYASPVSVVKLNGIQAKALPDILIQASIQSGKDKVVLFSDLHGENMVGAAVGVTVGEMQQNPYVINPQDCNGEAVMFLIRSNAYDMFRESLMGGAA